MKQHAKLLKEGVKPVKVWAMSDSKIKPHYALFKKWFKTMRDNGLEIGIPTNAARGTIILLERDWKYLRDAFLKRAKTTGVRGARGYGKKNKVD